MINEQFPWRKVIDLEGRILPIRSPGCRCTFRYDPRVGFDTRVGERCPSCIEMIARAEKDRQKELDKSKRDETADKIRRNRIFQRIKPIVDKKFDNNKEMIAQFYLNGDLSSLDKKPFSEEEFIKALDLYASKLGDSTQN